MGHCKGRITCGPTSMHSTCLWIIFLETRNWSAEWMGWRSTYKAFLGEGGRQSWITIGQYQGKGRIWGESRRGENPCENTFTLQVSKRRWLLLPNLCPTCEFLRCSLVSIWSQSDALRNLGLSPPRHLCTCRHAHSCHLPLPSSTLSPTLGTRTVCVCSEPN